MVMMGMVAGACSASYPTEPSKARPLALYLAFATPKGRVAPGNSTITNGYAMFAYTVDADGAYERVSERVTWSTSDDGVVRRSGNVTSAGIQNFLAAAVGNAEVIAQFQGLQASAPVAIVASEIVFRTPRIDLTWSGRNTIGTPSKATAFLRPSNQDVSNSATWTSSDPAVATVSDGGAITAVGKGTTIITANVNGLVDWFWFSVLPPS